MAYLVMLAFLLASSASTVSNAEVTSDEILTGGAKQVRLPSSDRDLKNMLKMVIHELNQMMSVKHQSEATLQNRQNQLKAAIKKLNTMYASVTTRNIKIDDLLADAKILTHDIRTVEQNEHRLVLQARPDDTIHVKDSLQIESLRKQFLELVKRWTNLSKFTHLKKNLKSSIYELRKVNVKVVKLSHKLMKLNEDNQNVERRIIHQDSMTKMTVKVLKDLRKDVKATNRTVQKNFHSRERTNETRKVENILLKIDLLNHGLDNSKKEEVDAKEKMTFLNQDLLEKEEIIRKERTDLATMSKNLKKINFEQNHLKHEQESFLNEIKTLEIYVRHAYEAKRRIQNMDNNIMVNYMKTGHPSDKPKEKPIRVIDETETGKTYA